MTSRGAEILALIVFFILGGVIAGLLGLAVEALAGSTAALIAMGIWGVSVALAAVSRIERILRGKHD